MALTVMLGDRCAHHAIGVITVSAFTLGCTAPSAPCAPPPANSDRTHPSSAASAPESRHPVAPEENSIPLEGELHLHQYQVYTDGGEHAFVVSPAGIADQMIPADRAFFFGKRTALRSHFVTAVERTGDSWSLAFFDAALAGAARGTLRSVNGRTTLACGQQSRDLFLVAGEKERALILRDTKFVEPRWAPVCMGRLGDDAFVYVDRAFRPEPLYRVFGGGRAAVHSLGSFTGDQVLLDGDDFDFFVEGGLLHCARVTETALGTPEYLVTWERPPTKIHLVPMPAHKNHRLIMRELGVYRPAPSPCDTLVSPAPTAP